VCLFRVHDLAFVLREWAEREDGFFVVLHAQLIAQN
jgi:hypothetical protein